MNLDPIDMKIPEYIAPKGKNRNLAKLFNEALFVLSSLGIPMDGMTGRKLEKMAMVFLAVADVKKSSDWPNARVREGKDALRSRDIIEYLNLHFNENISRGSYDDIRRKDLKLPVVAEIIRAGANNPTASRNDPTRRFSLAPNYCKIICQFGKSGWLEKANAISTAGPTLAEHLKAKRKLQLIPVTLNTGKTLKFSPGQHNLLQRAIIEIFLPRYGYGAEVLYVGDTAKKFLVHESEKLRSLGFFELDHGELPDIVAYSGAKNWLFLIEAVHSSGQVSQIRLLELQRLLKGCKAEIIYVTAFLDRATFRKFSADLAWETEVWIAEEPDHVIHFDGHKYLSPYKPGDPG